MYVTNTYILVSKYHWRGYKRTRGLKKNPENSGLEQKVQSKPLADCNLFSVVSLVLHFSHLNADCW